MGKYVCKKCKGRGWVRSWEFLAFTVFAPIALLVEAGGDVDDVKNSVNFTKKICDRCNGTGETDLIQ